MGVPQAPTTMLSRKAAVTQPVRALSRCCHLTQDFANGWPCLEQPAGRAGGEDIHFAGAEPCSEEPAPDHPGERFPRWSQTPKPVGFLAVLAQVSLLDIQEAHVGTVWFYHNTGKTWAPGKFAGLEKFSPSGHTTKCKTAAHYTEGKGKPVSLSFKILLFHIKENISAYLFCIFTFLK